MSGNLRAKLFSLKKQVSSYFETDFHPSFFGLAFAFCLTYSIQRITPNHSDGFFQVSLFAGTSFACLLLLLIAKVRHTNTSSNKTLIVAGPLVGALCTLLLVVPSSLSDKFSVIVGLSFLCGMVIGWLYLLWGSFYRSLGTKVTIAVLFGSTILAAFLKTAILLLIPGIPVAIVCALLPICSVFCWSNARKRARDQVFSSKKPVIRKSVIKRYTTKTLYVFKYLIAGVIAFSLAIGVIRSLDLSYFSQPLFFEMFSHVLVIVVALGILSAIYRAREDFEFSRMWFFALLAIATGLVMASVHQGSLISPAFAILSAAQMFVLVFLWLGLADISQNSSFSSDSVFGIGWVLYSLPVALGSYCSLMFGLDLNQAFLSLIVIWVLLIATFFLTSKHTPQELQLLADLNPPLSPDRIDRLASKVDDFTSRFGLSEREKEVVILYAQGRNRAFISSRLFISENTVRDHLRSVYHKMDIHNKQELIDILQ